MFTRNKKEEVREKERERERENMRDWPFLPRTGPLQNVIMLIRDWLENVKCTKRSTAGYHASLHWSTHPRPSLAVVSLFTYHSLSLSSSVCRSLLGAPDIYGIFLIARSLHSALLARYSLLSTALVPGGSRGPRNVSIFITVDASAAHTVPNCGQVLSRLFEDPPRYRERRSR